LLIEFWSRRPSWKRFLPLVAAFAVGASVVPVVQSLQTVPPVTHVTEVHFEAVSIPSAAQETTSQLVWTLPFDSSMHCAGNEPPLAIQSRLQSDLDALVEADYSQLVFLVTGGHDAVAYRVGAKETNIGLAQKRAVCIERAISNSELCKEHSECRIASVPRASSADERRDEDRATAILVWGTKRIRL
jgi:hypothetical protein